MYMYVPVTDKVAGDYLTICNLPCAGCGVPHLRKLILSGPLV